MAPVQYMRVSVIINVNDDRVGAGFYIRINIQYTVVGKIDG